MGLIGAIVDGVTAAGNAKHDKLLDEAKRQENKYALDAYQPSPQTDPRLDLAVNALLFSLLIAFIIFIIQQTRT